MKFKYIFERIDGIEVYPLFSLILFFTFFVVLLVWVFRIKPSHINKFKQMPLEDATLTVNPEAKQIL